MGLTRLQFEQAEERARKQREAGYVRFARYDRNRGRVILVFNTGVEMSFPTSLAEGLAHALPEDLSLIEISPSGLGLRWPRLDADFFVPALMQGIFGSKSWMAAQMGAAGGKSRSAAKAAAARKNGRKGGRPRRAAGGSGA